MIIIIKKIKLLNKYKKINFLKLIILKLYKIFKNYIFI